MKAVYTQKINVRLNINGEWVKVEEISGRCCYRYGEVPENYVEKYDNEETVFDYLASYYMDVTENPKEDFSME